MIISRQHKQETAIPQQPPNMYADILAWQAAGGIQKIRESQEIFADH